MKEKEFPKHRIEKIERNMKFVRALIEELNFIEVDADHMRTDSAESYGMRRAVKRIRDVIDEHTD